MANCTCGSHAQNNGLCNSCQEDDPHEPSKKVRNPDQRAFAIAMGWGKKQEGGMPSEEEEE